MFVGEEYQQMKKNWIKNLMGLVLILISQGCSNPNNMPTFYYDKEIGIIISYNGLDRKYPIDNQTDVFANPTFSIDSINRVVYFNNFNKEFIAFSLRDKKELGHYILKKENDFSLSENRDFKINIVLDKNIVILNSNRNLWVFDLKLSKLYANYIDSLQMLFNCRNLGYWNYSIQDDSLNINLEKDTSIYLAGSGDCSSRYSFILPNAR